MPRGFPQNMGCISSASRGKKNRSQRKEGKPRNTAAEVGVEGVAADKRLQATS